MRDYPFFTLTTWENIETTPIGRYFAATLARVNGSPLILGRPNLRNPARAVERMIGGDPGSPPHRLTRSCCLDRHPLVPCPSIHHRCQRLHPPLFFSLFSSSHPSQPFIMAFVPTAAAVRLSAARSSFVCRAAVGSARAALPARRVAAATSTRTLSMAASPTVTNTVYFDITIGGQPSGRVTFGLFGDDVYVLVNGVEARCGVCGVVRGLFGLVDVSMVVLAGLGVFLSWASPSRAVSSRIHYLTRCAVDSPLFLARLLLLVRRGGACVTIM